MWNLSNLKYNSSSSSKNKSPLSAIAVHFKPVVTFILHLFEPTASGALQNCDKSADLGRLTCRIFVHKPYVRHAGKFGFAVREL